MGAITGDFGKLNKKILKLQKVADPAERTALNQSLAEETVNLIAEGFSSGMDPYGQPWDAPNNLQITGRMRSYAPVNADANGFMVAATDQKAIWHHAPRPRARWGGKALPTRLQVPIAARGLPARWNARYREAIEDFLRARLE